MNPGWLASTMMMLAGICMILVGHFYGAYDAFIIFGVIALVLGIVVSTAVAGLTNWIALLSLFTVLLVFLIAIDFYNLWGLRGWV